MGIIGEGRIRTQFVYALVNSKSQRDRLLEKNDSIQSSKNFPHSKKDFEDEPFDEAKALKITCLPGLLIKQHNSHSKRYYCSNTTCHDPISHFKQYSDE